MAGVAQWFAEGGVWMYAILLLDVIGILMVFVAGLVALVARIRGRTGALVKAFPALVLVGAVLPVVVGAVGYFSGRSAALDAASTIKPALRADLLTAGFEIAMIPLRFGGVSTVVLGSLAVVAVMMAPWASRR